MPFNYVSFSQIFSMALFVKKKNGKTSNIIRQRMTKYGLFICQSTVDPLKKYQYEYISKNIILKTDMYSVTPFM